MWEDSENHHKRRLSPWGKVMLPDTVVLVAVVFTLKLLLPGQEMLHDDVLMPMLKERVKSLVVVDDDDVFKATGFSHNNSTHVSNRNNSNSYNSNTVGASLYSLQVSADGPTPKTGQMLGKQNRILQR